MAGISLDRNKGKVSDIKQNIESKKGELSQLEENKQKLLEAGTDIQASDIDEDVQKILMEKINQSLEENSEKGEQLSQEMNTDVKDLESMKQEVDESKKSNEQERSKLEKKKELLDKVGLGGSLEEAISELNNNYMNLEDFQASLTETQKELNSVSQRLSSL